jgi:hypothetical protein
MTEFLDECHLCGHVIASAAPACPNCFGRSDPVAREARREAQRIEQARRAMQQAKAWEEDLRREAARRAARADSQRLKVKIGLGFVCFYCLPTVLSVNGFAWVSVFPVVAYLVWLFRDRLFASKLNSPEEKPPDGRESFKLDKPEAATPYAGTSNDFRLSHHDHTG